MLIILKVHVQTLCQLGIVTFNSSAVAHIKQFINFFMLVSPLLMVSPGAVRTPARS